jgi:electron transport complex protein RnfB
MDPESQQPHRRRFLMDGVRLAGIAAVGAAGGVVAIQRAAGETRWQIDPDKCIACTHCATYCVLDESAVKAVQFFDLCGYCEICTGYFDPKYQKLDTAAENQLCPTGAVVRTFIEEKAGQRFFEYSIDEDLCIGCGKCVRGCALMNGSLYLQVLHDRCVNCNECAIAVVCPTQAFLRAPADQPYRLKRMAVQLQKSRERRAESREEEGDHAPRGPIAGDNPVAGALQEGHRS